jgi:thiol reductant ABC exporter CydC subunit
MSSSNNVNMSNARVMWRLLGLVRPLAGFMVLSVVCGVLGFCAATGIPVGAAWTACLLATSSLPIPLSTVVIVLIAMGVARGVLHYIEQRCNHYIAFRLLAHVRDLIFASLRKLAPAKLASADKGSLISTITSDVELLEVFFAHTISPICIAAVMAAVMAVFLGSFHWLFAVIALVGYVVVGVVEPLIVSRASGDLGDASRKAAGDLSGFVLDNLRGVGEILQYQAGERRVAELDRRSRELVGLQRGLRTVSARGQAILTVLVVAFSAAVLVAGLLLFDYGEVDAVGVVVATVTVFSSFGPFLALANLGSTLQTTLASGRRVIAILDEEPIVVEVTDGEEVTYESAAVQDVGFSYGEEKILDDVNMEFPARGIVGITGKSGSGKSTLCRLLMRFWDVDEGRILMSGVDVRSVNTSSLRDNEAFVEQDTYLFHDSIRDNLRIAKHDATDEEIRAACKAAAIDDFIMSLPKGYDTMVGELGDTLSGGERQRLGLARAFLHDARLLLLDEPTSNLDSLNEGRILKSLEEQRKKRCTVLISHRASTTAIADLTFSMDSGRVS